MRPLAVAGAAVVAMLAAPATSDAAPERDALIRPGVGIGKVRLGMRLADVRRALGPRFILNKRVRRGFGVTYVELGWDNNSWRVGFVVRRGRYRTVLVGTMDRRERTARGVGAGSSLSMLRRRTRVTCLEGRDGIRRPYRDPTVTYYHYCAAGAAGGRQTVFLIGCTRQHVFSCPGYAVDEVVVREPF